MTLTIYATPISIYNAKLRVLLRHKGMDYNEEPPPGGYRSAAYRRVVPSGNIPAMVHDGLMLADSEAIAEYLEERFPDPPALPENIAARAKAREMSRFHDTRLEPELRALFPILPPNPCPDDIREKQSAAINVRLSQLGVMLAAAPATGTALTLGDCGFPVTFAWLDAVDAPLGLSLDWPAEVLAYRDRLATHDAVRDEIAHYTPIIDAWMTRT